MKFTENRVYARVRDRVAQLTNSQIACMRSTLFNPALLDRARKRLQQHSVVMIEHVSGWEYGIFYGEEELNELVRQLK